MDVETDSLKFPAVQYITEMGVGVPGHPLLVYVITAGKGTGQKGQDICSSCKPKAKGAVLSLYVNYWCRNVFWTHTYSLHSVTVSQLCTSCQYSISWWRESRCGLVTQRETLQSQSFRPHPMKLELWHCTSSTNRALEKLELAGTLLFIVYNLSALRPSMHYNIYWKEGFDCSSNYSGYIPYSVRSFLPHVFMWLYQLVSLEW